MNRDISSIRRDYQFEDLLEQDVPSDPIPLFDDWLKKAIEVCPDDPTAMILSTSDQSGMPHGRVVLLKQRDDKGFVFFTNYDSRKGQELADNPKASLTFFWPQLSRQVRVEGTVSKVTREESSTYFASRPKGSQLAASISPQSRVVPDRASLHRAFEEKQAEFEDQDLPCPENWGGYRLSASYIEFWQGRPSRLHDRLSYQKDDEGQWSRQRLAP